MYRGVGVSMHMSVYVRVCTCRGGWGVGVGVRGGECQSGGCRPQMGSQRGTEPISGDTWGHSTFPGPGPATQPLSWESPRGESSCSLTK